MLAKSLSLLLLLIVNVFLLSCDSNSLTEPIDEDEILASLLSAYENNSTAQLHNFLDQWHQSIQSKTVQEITLQSDTVQTVYDLSMIRSILINMVQIIVILKWGRIIMQPNFLTALKIIGLSLIYLSCQNIIGDDNQLESGVEGTVLRGPMCPGPVSEANPCPDQPFSALFHVFNKQGAEAAIFQSDAQGDFRVHLRPGEYTIIPDESAPIIYPTGQPKNVLVQDRQYTKVTLEFDTGIR